MIGASITPLARLVATGLAVCAQDSHGNPISCDTGLPTVGAGASELQTLLQIGFGVLAAISVLMIVIAGLRFVTAQGNPQETAKARNTIIYAAAGLVIALSAEGIVALVLGKL